ncbi:MAG TPA: GNAT family N-acetyltransferase [Williamwhitmania sp.]|nr:GNAT family N-acetyltransferase [Williamwhitmania sp.]
MHTYPTARLTLRSLTPADAPLLQAFLVRNRQFLQEWEPKRDEEYFSIDSARWLIDSSTVTNDNKTGLSLYLFRVGEEKIIGHIGLSNIVYGPFLSCFLGYKLDFEETNIGYISEGLQKVIQVAFDDYKLHRIEANVMPRNIRSIKALEKLKFEQEGISERYLKINGKWEDHLHYVLLNPKVE